MNIPKGTQRHNTAALNNPEHWQLEKGRIQISAQSMIYPGGESYRLGCWTLCGCEFAILDGHPVTMISAYEYMRRIRILSSLQHHLQNGCAECAKRLRSDTSAAERQWLYCSDPTLGDILGMEQADRTKEAPDRGPFPRLA